MLSVLSSVAKSSRLAQPLNLLTAAIDRSYTRALREDGLLSRTMVQGANGWVPVDGIAPGDIVMTFDNGPQRVRDIHPTTIARKGLPASKAFAMFVPAGALGNDTDLTLMPFQEVIVECDQAEAEFGDPFVLFPAMLLEGYRGIRRDEFKRDLKLTMLTFDSEQIIPIAGGALASCRAESDFSPLGAAEGQHRTPDNTRYDQDTLARLAKTLRGVDA